MSGSNRSVCRERSGGRVLLPPPNRPRGSCARAVPGGDGSAQWTGTIHRGTAPRLWTARARNQARPTTPASTGGDGSTGGRRFGQRLAAIRAELRAGIVLPAAILASAQGHKVRWPNLLLNASLRHMRLARIALLVAATGCAASTAARRASSPTAPVPSSREMLLSPEGRLRYARGVVRGIEDFLREMAK